MRLYLTVTECDDGTYGYNCVNNCSGHCLSEFSCNKQTGQCDRECNPGYTNSDCSKSKLFPYFIIFRVAMITAVENEFILIIS